MSNCVVFLGHSVLSDKSANLCSPTAALTSSKLLVGSLDSTDFSSQSLKCRESKILKSQVDFNITKSPAEAVCDDFLKKLRFVGYEALSARSYLSGSADAREANSRKSAQTATQILSNSKIVSEKCGGSGKSQGSYLSGDLCDFSPLPHLSPQAELLNFNIKDTQ